MLTSDKKQTHILLSHTSLWITHTTFNPQLLSSYYSIPMDLQNVLCNCEVAPHSTNEDDDANVAGNLTSIKPNALQDQRADTKEHEFTLHKRGKLIAKTRRGLGFTLDEGQFLLDLVERHLPVGPTEWDAIQRMYKKQYPDRLRTTESLRGKYNRLCRTRVPSGSSQCPPLVTRAKRIRAMLKQRCEIRHGTEAFAVEDTVSDYYSKADADAISQNKTSVDDDHEDPEVRKGNKRTLENRDQWLHA